MSSVITLRARLVAGCALALVALTGCAGSSTTTDPMDKAHRVQLELPSNPEPVARGGIGTGVSPALEPDGDALSDEADRAAQPHLAASSATASSASSSSAHRTTAGHARSSSSAPAPAPVVQPVAPAPAPVVEPAPAEPTCATGEEWDGEHCVARQLPEESIGGARCPDPAQVVVAILEDGTPVCGTPDDTVTVAG